jgi:hypothetical protein
MLISYSVNNVCDALYMCVCSGPGAPICGLQLRPKQAVIIQMGVRSR